MFFLSNSSLTKIFFGVGFERGLEQLGAINYLHAWGVGFDHFGDGLIDQLGMRHQARRACVVCPVSDSEPHLRESPWREHFLVCIY
jgi:hypothetical protein